MGEEEEKEEEEEDYDYGYGEVNEKMSINANFFAFSLFF